MIQNITALHIATKRVMLNLRTRLVKVAKLFSRDTHTWQLVLYALRVGASGVRGRTLFVWDCANQAKSLISI